MNDTLTTQALITEKTAIDFDNRCGITSLESQGWETVPDQIMAVSRILTLRPAAKDERGVIYFPYVAADNYMPIRLYDTEAQVLDGRIQF